MPYLRLFISGICISSDPTSSKMPIVLDFLVPLLNLRSSSSQLIRRSFRSFVEIIRLIPSKVWLGDSPNAYSFRGVMLGVSGRLIMGDCPACGEEYYSSGLGKLAWSGVFGLSVAIRGLSTIRSKPSTYYFICDMYTSL